MISRPAHKRLLSTALATAFLIAAAFLPTASQAQVVPDIKGGGSQINVYGMFTLVKSDFQSTLDYPPNNPPPDSTNDATGFLKGGAVGADFRLGHYRFGQPSLGTRLTYANGTFGSQRTILFGPELHYIYKRYRPYGNFLIGPGNIVYKNGLTDSSIVYSYGGGVDYHRGPKINFRMIDFQYQSWNLGTHFYPPVPGVPGVYVTTRLKPYTLGFGVLVRVW